MLYEALQDEVFVRGGVNSTSGFITEKMVRDWLGMANTWAATLYKWPFTEYMDKSAAFTGGVEVYDYMNAQIKTDSIRIMKIGTYRFKKLNFDDYLKYREDYPSGNERLFSDFGRQIHVNPNCASGTMYAYTQKVPDIMGTVDYSTASTIFQNFELEGEQAVIERALSYVYDRKKDVKNAAKYVKSSKMTLQELFTRIQEEKHAYKTQDRRLFEDFDVINGDSRGDNPLRF